MGGKKFYNKKLGITTPNLPEFYAVIWRFEKTNSFTSESGGFEPPVPCSTHPFQGCAIDRSASFPRAWRYLAVTLLAKFLCLSMSL